ncbi:MAG: glycosyltransferase [Chloroflexi bacterium]|nr:MAG: glycosyltransferase [Chloroflexota bacterium]
MLQIMVLKTGIHVISYLSAMDVIEKWARLGESRYICAANVHTIMDAYDSPEFMRVISQADLVVPDGMPLVWIMRAKGQRRQTRVYGPTLMLHVLEAAARENLSVGFYGSKPEVLNALIKRMQARYEGLRVVFSCSPPFREMSRTEDLTIIEQINQSGARILFVGLGCPKQEIWMADHRSKVKAVMIGVGAAFDFHAGIKPQAPMWMQKIGLEWLFRLFTEPRRLWKRYLYHNPRFVFLAVADLLGLLKKAD